jgi:hypothetical protein
LAHARWRWFGDLSIEPVARCGASGLATSE